MIPGLSTPWALLIAGILLLTWVFNHFSKPLSKLLSVIGLPFGIYIFVLAILRATQNLHDNLAIILLALAGISLFARSLKNIKWAALLATLVGVLLTYIVSLLFLNIPLMLLLLVFSVFTLMTYLIFKFAEDFIQAIGTLLNFPPISTVLGILCIIKAISLLIL